VAGTSTLPPIFGMPIALPRGPHDLTREAVAAAQRGRLLDGVTSVVAEKGFPQATISEIARRAGVSPNVFYEHFAGKEVCYLAAYEVFTQALLERIAGDVVPGTGLQEFITTALAAYLGTLEAEPSAARAFVLEGDGAGAEARRRRHAAYAAIAAVLKQRYDELRLMESDDLEPLPDLAFMAIVHGVRELACDAMEGRIEGSLTDIAPDIERWLTATFLGRRT
jgi:AcrR family transcriptional regulator